MLKPSELGKRDFWNRRYELELKNYDDTGDVGEIWFGTKVESRMVSWISKYVDALNQENLSVCEVGCGNGHLLVSLGRKLSSSSVNVSLYGGDYSEPALKLGEKLVSEAGLSDAVKFLFMDLLNVEQLPHNNFDVILDKGTFDAICLNGEHCGEMTPAALYHQSMAQMLKPGGAFLISSCNWTSDELISLFSGSEFSLIEVLPAPSFSFGGKSGTTASTVAFKRL